MSLSRWQKLIERRILTATVWPEPGCETASAMEDEDAFIFVSTLFLSAGPDSIIAPQWLAEMHRAVLDNQLTREKRVCFLRNTFGTGPAFFMGEEPMKRPRKREKRKRRETRI
jgi:hypothetical protein